MENAYYSPGVQLLQVDVATLGPFWERLSFSAPNWRLYWNPAPGASVCFEDRLIELDASRLVLIPPETGFAGRVSRPVSHLYLHFLLRAPYNAAISGLHTLPAAGTILTYARELHGLALAHDAGRRCSLLAMALIHAAICHIPETALRPMTDDPRVVEVMSAMDAHLAAPLSNDDLAKVADMSTNAFIRLFRRTTGMTPQECYTRKRIDRTCMQLQFSDLKVDDIATQAGFCDRYHFSRAFKRLRGISPAAFRRQAGPRS